MAAHDLSLSESERPLQPDAGSRFVRRFLLLLGAQLAAVAGLNLLVNPQGIYPVALLPPVVADLRAQKAYLLQHMQPKPRVLILGSSRVMKIPPRTVERLTGLRAFNAGMLSAYTEDDYATLRYAVERAGVQPRLVLLGVELEALHDHEPVNQSLLDLDSMSAFLQNGEGGSRRWKHIAQLLSWDQTELSLRSLRHWAVAPRATEPAFRIDPDGRLVYVSLDKGLANGTLDRGSLVLQSVTLARGRYQNFGSVSAPRVAYLEATLRYCHEHNIRVVVFLTPIHHLVRQQLAPYRQKDAEFASAVEQTAARWGAEFHDLRDVETFGGRPDGFYDGTHVDDDNADRMAAWLLRTAADRAVQ